MPPLTPLLIGAPQNDRIPIAGEYACVLVHHLTLYDAGGGTG